MFDHGSREYNIYIYIYIYINTFVQSERLLHMASSGINSLTCSVMMWTECEDAQYETRGANGSRDVSSVLSQTAPQGSSERARPTGRR